MHWVRVAPHDKVRKLLETKAIWRLILQCMIEFRALTRHTGVAFPVQFQCRVAFPDATGGKGENVQGGAPVLDVNSNAASSGSGSRCEGPGMGGQFVNKRLGSVRHSSSSAGKHRREERRTSSTPEHCIRVVD